MKKHKKLSIADIIGKVDPKQKIKDGIISDKKHSHPDPYRVAGIKNIKDPDKYLELYLDKYRDNDVGMLPDDNFIYRIKHPWPTGEHLKWMINYLYNIKNRGRGITSFHITAKLNISLHVENFKTRYDCYGEGYVRLFDFEDYWKDLTFDKCGVSILFRKRSDFTDDPEDYLKDLAGLIKSPSVAGFVLPYDNLSEDNKLFNTIYIVIFEEYLNDSMKNFFHSHKEARFSLRASARRGEVLKEYKNNKLVKEGPPRFPINIGSSYSGINFYRDSNILKYEVVKKKKK